METIEIRQNKKKLIPMFVMLAAALTGMTYYIYFSGTFEVENTITILYILCTALLIYTIYIPTKKLFKNEPVLTFSKYELEINDKGKPVSLLWQQVMDWRIEKESDGDTRYLIVVTTDRERKINISWLDKKPDEIEELLQIYRKR